MPSMFSTHTNEVEIIIGLLMTCWKMVPLWGLCLHFLQSLRALNLTAVSCATNWASLCFWSELPAIARSLQTFPCPTFSLVAAILLIHKQFPSPTIVSLWCGFWPHFTHVMLRAGLSVLFLFPPLSSRQRKCRLVGCQDAVWIWMTGKKKGKVSSNTEFYFSAFPLHA